MSETPKLLDIDEFERSIPENGWTDLSGVVAEARERVIADGEERMRRELALDVTAERARALHRVVRAMHDGHCPKCGCLDDAARFVADRDTEAERHSCPQCSFTIYRHEAEAALAEFNPFLQKSVAIFEEWRRTL